ncbi:thioredoxin-like protein [Gaertneriomyces semiglobifer]|nr:thioredoxin-like protein [Gaertneriomyces semiglobifer]
MPAKRKDEEGLAEPPTKRRSLRLAAATPAEILEAVVPVVSKPRAPRTKLTADVPLSAPPADAFLEGQQFPQDFPTLSSTGEPVNLVELTQTQGAVIFLYPRASTPGCTQQACFFRDSHPDFQKAGYTVYGLSRDSVNAQTKFKEKHKMGFELISDVDGHFVKAFGLGKGDKGVARSVVVIKKGGMIVLIKKAGPKPTLEAALEAIKA